MGAEQQKGLVPTCSLLLRSALFFFVIFGPFFVFFEKGNCDICDDKYLGYLHILVGPSSFACLWIFID